MSEIDEATKAKAAEEKAKGTAAYKKKDFETALKHYNAAAALDPTDMVFHLNIGAVYYEMKEFDKSIESCNKASEVGFDNRADFKLVAKAYGRMGKAHAGKGDYTNAVKFYDKALTNHRDKAYLVPKQEAQRKIKEQEKLAYINPEIALEAKARGNGHFKEGQYPDAIREYTEALKRNPDDVTFASRIYSNRAACYTKLMELPHALKDSEECIKLDPAFIKGYLRKANCLISMKREKDAEAAYNEALTIDPNNAEAREGVQRARMAKMGAQANMSREEKATLAAQDPEIQQILGDPVMQQILKQMQENPASAQEHLQNPVIMQKIAKLAESGILEMR